MLYKCPSEWYLSSVQRAAGWIMRVRSYSMNQFLGAEGQDGGDQYSHSYLKQADLQKPGPAMLCSREP
jgi:succinate dehydrogenase/fumarate reductase cytochrome b subunit